MPSKPPKKRTARNRSREHTKQHHNPHIQKTALKNSQIILFNKPFQVISQFSKAGDKTTLATFIKQPGFYPAGRLDYDSEGLLILTNDGQLQARITQPKFHLQKTYWVQVEGEINSKAIKQLRSGVNLKDGLTRPAQASVIGEPQRLWARHPPIRQRRHIATSWLELKIKEGKNRQVRRMTAAVGFPTLRLIRYAVGPWTLDDLAVGEHQKYTLDDAWEI